MVRQLEEELRMRMRGPSVEVQQQIEVLYNENEHLTREIAILRDTIKVRDTHRYALCRSCELQSYPRTLPLEPSRRLPKFENV